MFVELRDGEGFEQMLRRFTQQVNRQGVLKEHRRRRFFVSKSEAERDRIKRNARRRSTGRTRTSSGGGGGTGGARRG